MKIKFIVNPISGKGKQKGIEDLIKENLDSKKYEYSDDSTVVVTCSCFLCYMSHAQMI